MDIQVNKSILIVLDGFPQLSETFILYHIITLKKAGYKVEIMANRQGKPPVHKLVNEYQLLRDTIYRPLIPLNRLKRMWVLLKYLFKCLMISPAKSIKCLNVFEFGKDTVNGNLIVSLYSYLKIKQPDFIHCQQMRKKWK